LAAAAARPILQPPPFSGRSAPYIWRV